jgi:transposase
VSNYYATVSSADFKQQQQQTSANIHVKFLEVILMGKKSDLTAQEKAEIVRKVAAGESTLSVAKELHRDHRTVKRFTDNATFERSRTEKSKFRSVSTRQLAKLRREVAKHPLSTSRDIFAGVDLPDVSRSTRCRILRGIALHQKAKAQPLLTTRHLTLRLQWAEKYMKLDFSRVLFTDEMRATLDGPDGWASGWIPPSGWTASRIRRQQGGGGVMVWAGIIDSTIVGPFLLKDGVKVTAQIYCDFLQENFIPWFKLQRPALRRQLVLMQDNAPSHAARLTTEFLAAKGFKDNKLMVWPPNSPDLNPIENLWSIVKARVYRAGRQFHSKQQLWAAIQTEMHEIESAQIRNLTASMDSRVLKVLRNRGRHTGM